jgi:hypothetical protein
MTFSSRISRAFGCFGRGAYLDDDVLVVGNTVTTITTTRVPKASNNSTVTEVVMRRDKSIPMENIVLYDRSSPRGHRA